MDFQLEKKLQEIAKQTISSSDPSHDFSHALRVLRLVKKIGLIEKADLDILIASALFHDVINYSKDSPKSKLSTRDSALKAREILKGIKEYPQEKIYLVEVCILNCSFSKNLQPDLLEARILQDADMLEATGSISIMRTFASCGQMRKAFYDLEDPFCERRNVNAFNYGLDLFYERLLVVESRMFTRTAKLIAKRRTAFLKRFLEELRIELELDSI